jgi:hypothetical protein
VRKGPEVLAMQVRDSIFFVDWLFPRMCFLLCHVKEGKIRTEIITTLVDVLSMWKDGNPSLWGELRKSTEMIKSYVSGKFLNVLFDV